MKNGRIKFILGAVSILLLLLNLIPRTQVSAQTPVPPSDDEVNAIASELFCPICENIPLDVCPTEACRDWRELIRQMLAEGKSEEEIDLFFVENYGARVLGTPPARGIIWFAYILPPVAFVIGVVLLFKAIRPREETAAKQGAAIQQGPLPPGKADLSAVSDQEYRVRLETELKKRAEDN